jgi:molybdate transport system permease protein
MTDAGVLFPLLLSLRVGLIAMAVVAPIGLLLGWVQARLAYRGRTLVDALLILPIVLPPTVVGYLLVVVLGRRGIVGGLLDRVFGVSLMFTVWAAVIAAAVVTLPFFAKLVQNAFEGVDPEIEAVARSLGAGPARTFLTVSIPAAARGLTVAFVVAFARALAEFGATLMFAGNVPGRTNTTPLEIFAAYQAGDDARAATLVAALTLFGVGMVLLASRLERGRW